jgi:ferredoxin
MKILMIYISPNHTTEKISLALRDKFIEQGIDVNLVNIGKAENRDPQAIPDDLLREIDLLGIGSPVYHMRMLEPLESYLKILLPRIKRGTKTFLYLTYGGITSGKAFINTARLLRKYDLPILGGVKIWAPHFYNPVPYPDEKAQNTVEQFCSELAERQFQAIPWQKVDQLFSYQTGKVRMIYPFTHLIGKKRELPIVIDANRCKKCGRCIRECPTGAIVLTDKVTRDESKCIYCYHCTTLCAQQAIQCPTEKIAEAVIVNKKMIGCEQPTNAVYF